MSFLQRKRTRTGWSARLLNLTLLAALILGLLAPPGAVVADNARSAEPLSAPGHQPAATTSSTAWVFQGPSPQINAQQDLANVTAADEPVSGAVSAIAASPTDPDLIYIGAANGGVWKTTNATAANPTWTPLTDHLQSLSIGLDAVALDPLDATDQTVIAGTGRFSGYANRGDDHVGIYYTTDGGANWAVSTSPLLSASRITGVAARGNTMLVAAEDGLFRTTGGVLGAWTKISGTGGLPDIRAGSIAADPNDTNRLYVTFTGASGGIFRSDDLGATWTNITTGISGITADTDAFDVAVFNDGATSTVNVVLDGIGGDSEVNAIFRSVNGGAFAALDVPDVFRDAYGKFGLTVDNSNANLVYISGGYALIGSNPFLALTYRLDASQPSGSQLTHLYSGVSTETLTSMNDSQTYMYVSSTASFLEPTPFVVAIESEDITVTEVTKPSWYYKLIIERGANGTTPAAHANHSMVNSRATYGAPHVDINTLSIDANGALLMGAHGGIHLLPDPANPSSAANYWSSKNGNLGVTEMHDVAYDHVSDVLIGANQDNCVVFQSAPGNLTWPVGPGFGGDGGDVAVADIGGGQSVRYASNQNLSSFSRLTYDAANNLVSDTDLSTSVVTDKQFTTPIAVNAVDPNRLLIGGSDNLYESLDMGDTINKIATVGVYNRAIAYGGRQNGVDNPDVLYVSDGLDTFYVRTTAGGEVIAKTLPSGAWYIWDIVINPEDWMNVFVVDDGTVLASDDAGDTWSDITGNLLSISSTNITTIEFVDGPSPYLVVGTRSGVFASNLGALGSWFELGTDLPDVLVYDLDYDAVDDVLAAGTLGRGAWLLSDASAALTPAGVPPILALSGSTTADEGSTATYNFTVTDPGDSFMVDSLTVGAGGELVPGSLVTAGSGGSFQVSFDDGPATVSIDLQVTDSTGLPSNLETVTVTVSNKNPSPEVLGLPSSGSPGTPVTVTAGASDPSAADTTAGFTYSWVVHMILSGTTYGYDSGSGDSFTFTPDREATFKVWLNATDKDGGNNWTYELMTAASPDLTVDQVSLTVPEGQAALNSGTFANVNGNPLTLSASVGTLTRETLTPPADLVSWWHADGDATDSVDGNDGTLMNGAGFAAGQAGQAFSFNGVNQYVSVPSSANIEMRNDFTAMAWFNVTSLAPGNYAKIFTKRPGSFGPYELDLWHDGTGIKARVIGSVDGATWHAITRNDPINTGTWYHGAIVIDGDNLLSFYIDGQLVDTLQFTTPVMDHTGAAFVIGTELGNLDPLNGLVDEVQIVNRALTASEIEAVYNHSPSVFGTWSWSFDTDDGPVESQDVTITATDDVNAEVTNLDFSLTVENVAPDKADGLQLNSAYRSPNEGASISVLFDLDPVNPPWSDPSVADVTAGYHYAFDFDNDGVFEVGDGTYAGSSTNRMATAPEGYLVDGPGTLAMRGRVIDKDGGYNDYIYNHVYTNLAPAHSVSGPGTGLVGQLLTFVVGANDPSAVDQAAGFDYSIDWGDGSPIENITRSEGNGQSITRHVYAATGNYTVEVIATDKDGGSRSLFPATISVQIDTLNTANLQTLIATEPFVELMPADDGAFQSEVTAINGLADPGTPVAITIILGVGPYTGVTLSPPSNIILDLAGNDTRDRTGTQITGSSPAVTVTSGEVFVQGNVLDTATDSPTVLVTGGHLTLDQVEIQESTGFNNVAIQVTGGSVNLGFDVLMNVNGEGGYVDSYERSALVPHPEGIDAELTPNTYQATQQADDGTLIQATINAVSLSSTGLTSSAATTTVGESVTFTAVVDVKAIEHGPATGTVNFFEGAALLGSEAVSKISGQFVADFTTDALSVGEHTIMAVYSGDDAYVASSAVLTHQVDAPVNNYQNTTTGQFYATLQEALDAALSGETIIPVGDEPLGGGGTVNTPGLTINLSGKTFGPGSPFLIVAAANTTILGPGTLDGDPTSTGTNSTDPAILVVTGGDNFIMEDVEVMNWEDGVEVQDSVASFKLAGNWIHDNTDAGLQVDTGVLFSGVVTIEGNLFKDNDGNGVENMGADVIDATYNSWGDAGGPTTGDFVSADVTYDPWIYSEVYLDMDPNNEAVLHGVDEDDSFDVALKVDAVNLYGVSFEFTYDTSLITLNSTTFNPPWDSKCIDDGSGAGVISYVCNFIGTSEWTDPNGRVATLNFTADLPGVGAGDIGPWSAIFDISHLEADTSTAAKGGVKVFVNNAGYGAASTTDRDITDPNDGQINITGTPEYTGYIDLQGRTNDSGATLSVYGASSTVAPTVLSTGANVSSGMYTTQYLSTPLALANAYWFQVDAALYLPTTATNPLASDWADSKVLSTRPLTTLNTLVLLGGDGTDDDVIDIADAGCIGGDYGTSNNNCSGGAGADSDVNGDGVTDILDLVLMGGNFGLDASPWTP